ncbi:MAG: RNA polymerase sigma factor [Sedimentisphaerales bacterium]|nr:RNA polymerase sigma factor [Sedimentisphaerales bacterium]
MTEISQNQLAKWYEDYEAELMLYAKQWHSEPQAEDIVQDAFIRLLKQRKSPDNVRAWLFRVVRNRAISKVRSLKQQQKADQKIQESEAVWFESSSSDLIDAGMAQNILQKLAANLREIVMLRIWGQMSLKEIAEITGKSIPWIHKEYKRALELIKKELEHSSCTKKKT